MPNIRIYELSKELGVSNKEVIDAANDIGLSVRSHASSVSEEEAKKIREKIQIPKDQRQLSDQAGETKEEIKVFRSESGEEVVERRKGSTVIIRRKKKVEEAETEELPVPEEEVKEDKLPGPSETDLPAQAVDHSEKERFGKQDGSAEHRGSLARVDSTPVEETSTSELSKPGTERITEPREQIAEEKTGVEKPDQAREEKEDDSKVLKKKGRKAKPKREDFIDEETLEELRKAFRTKLPGRRREYLVEDRRSRGKALSDGGGYRKTHDNTQKVRSFKNAEMHLRESESAQVIPFPTKPAKRVIKVGESINVGDLAKSMSVKTGDVIKKLMSLGANVTINQSIDHETASILAEEFGYEVSVDIFEEEEFLLDQQPNESEELSSRHPVVTVMGHVDHGKTTLLDAIRHTKVVEQEAGGITQHIGAYGVKVDDREVVFIDTPGHEAFTAMRARGAQVTDIVILVVAADDGVMPQTIEAINHAKAAGVPIVVAINKIDKPDAKPDNIKRQLSEVGLVPEEWGGDTLFAEISAKKKTGINELLELILLQADILELRANPNKRANGVVIEAQLDKGRGSVATVLVKEGTLRVGDYMISELTYGRVRALMDDQGNRIEEAGPSIPVEVMGLSGVPSAGELFYVVKDEKTARQLISYRESKERKKIAAKQTKLSLEDLFESLEKGETKELPLVIKADTQGSVEALKESITKLSTDKCRVKIVHAGVGAINETDVVLASASNAVVVGFNVRPDINALESAERENVSLELHTVIYDAVDRIKKAMEGLLEPVIKEKVIGHVEVKATFHVSKMGTIAGCLVTDGKVVRGHNIRVVRDGVVIFEGKISSLKRFKDDAREVQSGYECGIGVENFNDIKVGDTFEIYTFEEIKQKL